MLEVIDFEAAGLGSQSYPIEVGIALADGRKLGWLIRPMPDWKYWCDNAEAIHGIPRERLFDEGHNVQHVCEMLNHYGQDKTFYSDCWVYDSSWLHLLFVSAGIRQTFSLSPIERELDERSLDQYTGYKKQAQKLLGLTPHRASNDAKIIQVALNMLINKPESAEVIPINRDAYRMPFLYRSSAR